MCFERILKNKVLGAMFSKDLLPCWQYFRVPKPTKFREISRGEKIEILNLYAGFFCGWTGRDFVMKFSTGVSTPFGYAEKNTWYFLSIISDTVEDLTLSLRLKISNLLDNFFRVHWFISLMCAWKKNSIIFIQRATFDVFWERLRLKLLFFLRISRKVGCW